ncbi:PUCC protein [Hyella patelloides LEGE 07179]|uniref:PUCC protein n=1 Tax=Hyella patelloides LEGE 07179 TaxID=945734 RepID=A0A563VJ79_9CYAN|nr:BCD family MFS transporter [Hyella patelloides]VEP11510.1 PUCC protein [Hyella patelloides LEGE 07179]
METSNYSEPSLPINPPRKVGILTVFRLGLFNLALGLMSVLTLAVLNRVMISELGIPATITAGTLALSQFIAPARVWFGQLSDTKPIFGRHRTGYVRLGAIVFSVAVFFAVQVVWQLGAVVRANDGWLWNTQTIGWTALLGLIMAVYGIAASCSSTPFTALLVDISEESNRSKLVAVAWSMLLVGIVIGGISGSIVLKEINPGGVAAGQIPLENLQAPINSVFAFVPFLVISLAFVATWGVEKKYSRFSNRSKSTEREDSMTLGKSLKILTASRQTGIFFSFLCLLIIGLFMQEAVLEPYGGEVFGMSIADTTRLNANWGVGILIGYSLTGFLVTPRLGKKLTTKLGCLLVAFSFILIILAGFTQEETVLQSAIVLFGITAGMATIGGISLMLDFTAAETAGTFIGAWGLAQAMSRAFATVVGGVILDIGRAIFTTPVLAYGSVFATQIVAMLIAVTILSRIDVKEFKDTTNKAIATVMEGDLD